CPSETREIEKEENSNLAELPQVYQNMGMDLGYFDEKGQLLKPLDPPPPPAGQDISKMSKKKQVEYLKNQVSNLPVGQEMKDKVSGVKNALNAAAKPKFGLLKAAMGLMSSRLGTFLPGPLGMVGKIKTLNGALGLLKNFLPKISVPGLLSKIGSLFGRGKKLAEKASDLVGKSNKLKDKFDDITQKTENLGKEIDKRDEAINAIQNKLDELANKKKELEAKLEDKPKKILEELRQQVGDVVKDANEMVEDVKKETDLKDKLLNELEELTKEKDKVLEELGKLEDEMKDLVTEQENLEEETKEAEKEVEEVKKQEEKVEEMQQEVEDLKSEEALKGEIADCEKDLNQLIAEITGLETRQDKLKNKLDGIVSWPGKLLDKVSNLKIFQQKLKLPENGTAVAEKTIAKVDGLMEKAKAIGSIAEILTGKKTKLQEQVENIDQKVNNAKNLYETKISNLDQLKTELVDLINEKTGIKVKFDQTIEDVDALEATVRDFINRYNVFDKKADCEDNKELEDEIEEVKAEQEEAEPALDTMEEELQEAEQQVEQLETETQQTEELIQEQQTIKEEYGTDVDLDPVTVEEWSETFEVERPYWEAVFHPDDEVVEGQKGRYFERKLKDAEKNVKLLFGPGEYCMSKSDFRKRYGSTISSFVTEALHSLKKSDQEKVKLFIQGSADISGHSTFSGKLNDQFHYGDISVLPSLEDDPERFQNSPVVKEIPDRKFRNEHLPNLRAQYLKEMILAYSKKFDPVVLEGAVKDFKDEDERNAIIYLFIPEELVSKYGDN
ncbi:MAG: hypothetical protein KDC24_11335, partial [Saprospiraceae bacterium]|nr:hypothetical protein [Saprospiraceae bacterium]